ncbi:hypothetical protein D5086_005252 [Populus alba]|uniref:Uncharacterized protein n=1 Tax=Populus alba TaxID=43335 RepID=A0ACC4CST7_POPAL
MAAKEGIRSGREGEEEEHVYRISTDKEWEELQRNGSCFGGQLDKSSGFIHLSKLDQVYPPLPSLLSIDIALVLRLLV